MEELYSVCNDMSIHDNSNSADVEPTHRGLKGELPMRSVEFSLCSILICCLNFLSLKI